MRHFVSGRTVENVLMDMMITLPTSLCIHLLFFFHGLHQPRWRRIGLSWICKSELNLHHQLVTTLHIIKLEKFRSVWILESHPIARNVWSARWKVERWYDWLITSEAKKVAEAVKSFTKCAVKLWCGGSISFFAFSATSKYSYTTTLLQLNCPSSSLLCEYWIWYNQPPHGIGWGWLCKNSRSAHALPFQLPTNVYCQNIGSLPNRVVHQDSSEWVDRFRACIICTTVCGST